MSLVVNLPINYQRRKRTRRALCGLSLHDRDDLLTAPLKTLQRIMGTRKPQDVPEILEDLAGGSLVIRGSLEIRKQEYIRDDLSIGMAWDWKERPTIHVAPEFRATERRATLGAFLRERRERRDKMIGQAYRQGQEAFGFDLQRAIVTVLSEHERRLNERDQVELDRLNAEALDVLQEESEVPER